MIVAVGGLFITGVIAVLVVGATVYAALFQGKVPEVLTNWGGILIGFFVGQFFSFAKAFLVPDLQTPATPVHISNEASSPP